MFPNNWRVKSFILKNVYKANFQIGLDPFDLLNAMLKICDTLYPNICIALRIFRTILGNVASGEWSFSALSRIKNVHKSFST